MWLRSKIPRKYYKRRELELRSEATSDLVGLTHAVHQALKQEMLELKSALNANQRETEKLKTQLTKAEKANDALRDELNHTRIKLKDQIEEMNNLGGKYDDLE